MAQHEHGAGAELGHGRDARRAIRASSSWARTWAISAACSAPPTACSASTASIACSIRRSPRAASSPRPSAWASTACKPVAEIQFADYIYPGFDQIVSELARLRYRTAGDFPAPVTIRTPCGGGIRGGQTHSQSPEAHVRARLRHQGRDAVQPLRRQGPADRVDRGRRPGDLLRAQAHLQRTLRRRPEQAGGAVEHARARATCPTATTPCRSAAPRSCARARR